jgi:hypothetical protein
MDNLNVTFNIPDWIQQGLKNSQYERLGGVIRDTKSGTIVAHLRETSFGLDKTLSNLNSVGEFASILNCGVSVVGFILILNKLNDIDKRLIFIETHLQIIELKIENINSKIDLSFKSELIGNLKQLKRAMLINEVSLRKKIIVNIVSSFEKSNEIFKDLLLTQEQKQEYYNYENLFILYQLYIFYYLSCVGLSISYLEFEELTISKEILQHGYEVIKQTYEEILMIDDDDNNDDNNDDIEKREDEFISMLELIGLEKTTIPPTSLIEYLFVGYRLKSDYELIEKRNQEKIQSAKKILKELRIYLKSLEGFLEEIKLIQKLKLTWVEWKNIQPVVHNSNSEYMYILTKN